MKILQTIALSTLLMLAVTGCSKGASTNDENTTAADSAAVVSNDSLQATTAEDLVEPEEPEAEPEPAYTGEGESAPGKSMVVDGITIKKGDPTVETLKKFKNVTWEYNADCGIIAYIGNAWIVVDEADDLTPQGREFMNGIYSDMVPDLQFSIAYIKPTAKIKELHNQ
jgi:hypothetical protein